ncbi:DegV family protein [Desulfogranum japonicum]|uniref:DegV family protein n=1 Tax=Desulfogranum japonicum TaxID=231447 RepID=UPI00041BDFA1|nr:DegV family protein [Desulfogranum japonicum]
MSLHTSLTAGYECLAAWSDLLDRINVFPVADSDTGTNLRISLSPLLHSDKQPLQLRDRLARAATGNSGNIAVAFFREFCHAAHGEELAKWARQGRDKAYKAVADPRAGTMLSFFDALVETLLEHTVAQDFYPRVMKILQQVVRDTTRNLADLAQAGVVDSGALGMYVFFDGFFRHCTAYSQDSPSVIELFADQLSINPAYTVASCEEHCVGAVIRTELSETELKTQVVSLGESVVMMPLEQGFKVHIHSSTPEQLRSGLQSIGTIEQWSDEQITQNGISSQSSEQRAAIHIVTDAAGSIAREIARQYGISLLDSYIVTSNTSTPESLCCPDQLYSLMKNGGKVTTAQASNYERYQHYQSICRQFGPSLYLSVGSAFTGNYSTAMTWRKANQNEEFTVLDTGAASGRLGLIALLTAQLANQGVVADKVISYAQSLSRECLEYVFIDELKYLVAGGRVSKAKGFFADLLHMKPIITPTAEGVRKLGVARNSDDQISFATKQLSLHFTSKDSPIILLQYTDNKSWVQGTVKDKIQNLYPYARIMEVPLSLTSGVHMGPGTWALAVAPNFFADN